MQEHIRHPILPPFTAEAVSAPSADPASALSHALEHARAIRPGIRPALWLCALRDPAAWRSAAPVADLREIAEVPDVWEDVATRAAEAAGRGECAILVSEGADGVRCRLLRPAEGREPVRPAPFQDADEIRLPGVVCADIGHDGRMWRMGAVTPTWREELAVLGRDPDGERLRALADRGVMLEPAADGAKPLAVMCCGQGSVWPGMGRELYDGFPAARAAMDRIAAAAEWDVLSLLDETDTEKIGLTRWQQPYLFLLEYAQWELFASLGLRPSLICGHSLGELIALCCAGVYSPEVAWYILDTRSIHMAELEAASDRRTGMMAVQASPDVVEEVLREWPSLHVSNYNTPHQCILSGPREILTEARRSLRKRRLPAIMLNISVAFHHPGMRMLRDLSLRRLNALEMHAPRTPMLSCITADFYPSGQREICESIADLDENTVRWVECVRRMRERDGIAHFLELGPQDTLCSLTTDCDPSSICFSAGRKGRETEAIRRACARLYALGHLPRPALRAAAARFGGESPAAARTEAAPAAGGGGSAAPDFGPYGAVVLEELAAACGRTADSLRPEMDLRYDLALRSSRFPMILQRIEERTGLRTDFDALLQVSTVGDLARVLGGGAPGGPARVRRDAGSDRTPPPQLLRLDPARLLGGGDAVLPADPSRPGIRLRRGDAVAILPLGPLDADAATRLADAVSGLAPLGVRLLLPETPEEAVGLLRVRGADASILASAAEAARRPDAARRLLAEAGAIRLILLADTDGAGTTDDMRAALDILLSDASCAVCLLRRASDRGDAAGDRPADALVAEIAEARGLVFRLLRLWDDGAPPAPREMGDLLAREIRCGAETRVCWARAATASVERPAAFALDGPRFPLIFCRRTDMADERASSVSGDCHFSEFADPALREHGGAETGLPHPPQCRGLQALLEAGSLLLPWLAPIGVSDMRFAPPPVMPPGVTREAKFHVRAAQWLRHDGVMARICPASLEVRNISANGRRAAGFSPMTGAVLLMGAGDDDVPPLWDGETPAAEGGADLLDAFYAARGHGPSWRLLEAISIRDEGACDALASDLAGRIALSPDAGHAGHAMLFEAMFQAACALMTLTAPAGGDGAGHGVPSPGDLVLAGRIWRPGAAGFLRFAHPAPDAFRGPLRIRVLRGWTDDRLVRYDAQITDAGGRVAATLNHLQFDAVPTGAASSEG